jgi:hydrogenase maturation protease
VSNDVLVAGIGNIFLGDDGFGPEVIRHLAAADQPPLPAEVRLVDYGIRGLHLSYDLLEGYAALIIVDAIPGNGRPGEVSVLAVEPEHVRVGGGPDPHGMDPAAVLAGLPALGGMLPPTYVVGTQPADTNEGIGLSAVVQAAVPVAGTAVRELLASRPWAGQEGKD